MIRSLRTALILFVCLSAITGIVYPVLVTGLAYLVFPYQAHGSLLKVRGKVVGSKLIGQNFTAPEFFWGRPSATSPMPYNAAASNASSLGPDNPTLMEHVVKRVSYLKKMDPQERGKRVPVDLVTSSFSGLDPDISPASAQYQEARVAQAGGLPVSQIRVLVRENTHYPLLGFLGEPVVNVLELNLALHQAYDIRKSRQPTPPMKS